MAITVRAGTAADYPAFAALRYHMDCERGWPAAAPTDFAATLERWLNRYGEAWHSFIAEDDGEPIGMIWLADVSRMPRPSDPSPDPIGYVTAFFVHERYRNMGVGEALLRAMNTAADERPYDTLIVWPSDRSVTAYQRAGFNPSEELRERAILHQ